MKNGLEGGAGSRGSGAPALSTQAGAWDRHAAESAGQQAPPTARTHRGPQLQVFTHKTVPNVHASHSCNITTSCVGRDQM